MYIQTDIFADKCVLSVIKISVSRGVIEEVGGSATGLSHILSLHTQKVDINVGIRYEQYWQIFSGIRYSSVRQL